MQHTLIKKTNSRCEALRHAVDGEERQIDHERVKEQGSVATAQKLACGPLLIVMKKQTAKPP
jgi:hypothetical protein